MDRSDLAKRMKGYEYVTRTHLITRMPVIIRLDGKAFHSFTKGFKRPFDEILIKTMQETMKYLCENIQGCVLGYTQSDEITLVLVDYKNFSTDAWFGYNVQKCTSIAASMATMEFNRRFQRNVECFIFGWEHLYNKEKIENIKEYESALLAAVKKGAMFDARIFNIPKEEVTNCVYWRQLDASRNSIQMVGQANFSHNELQNKNCNQIQDMLVLQRGINWNDLPTYQKRGSCCVKTDIKTTIYGEVKTSTVERPHWKIDKDIPIFKGDGRNYIDKLVYVGD